MSILGSAILMCSFIGYLVSFNKRAFVNNNLKSLVRKSFHYFNVLKISGFSYVCK